MRAIYQRKVNGETVDDNLEEALLNNANANLVHNFIVKGNYEVEESLLVFLVENVSHLNDILLNAAPLVSVCSVVGKYSGELLTSIVFAKKK